MAPYLVPDDIRASNSKLTSPARFPDATLAALIAEYEDIVETYNGVAYVARTTTEVRSIEDDQLVRLRWAEITGVTSVTMTYYGATYALNTSVMMIDPVGGFVDLGGRYTGMASVVYGHGIPTTPPGILRGCRLYVAACALRDDLGVGRDVITQAGPDGGQTRYVTPDPDKGRPTGYIEVDRIITGERCYRSGIG